MERSSDADVFRREIRMSMISEQIKTLQRIADRLETDPELDMEIGHIQDFWAKDIRDAIDIIETLSAKVRANNLHDGWIPCSERLPEEHDSFFTRFVDKEKWNESMFEKISDEVNVTVVDDKGQKTATHAHTVDGKWSCDLLRCNKDYRIIAWMPLPEPYKEN